MNLLDKEKELFEIRKGTTLYRKEFKNYRKVKVYDIYLEKYINGWKTIIKVITDSKIIYTYFASDLGMNLFAKSPEDLESKGE